MKNVLQSYIYAFSVLYLAYLDQPAQVLMNLNKFSKYLLLCFRFSKVLYY